MPEVVPPAPGAADPSEAAFGLVWPGKAAARAHAEAPAGTHLTLSPEATAPSVEAALAGLDHLLVEGDNLDALKGLRHHFGNRVRLVFIDPPYNTGRGMDYDDRFELGASGYATRYGIPRGAMAPNADLGRMHAAWLDLMYPRLVRARDLLADDGVLCVAIDDGEVHHLRMLCDEIFGPRGFVATFVWETKRAARGVPPRTGLMTTHEYVVCYARDRAKVVFHGLDRDAADFANPDGDLRGPWRSESMKATGTRRNIFELVDPATGLRYRGNWAFSEATLARMVADGRVVFPSDPGGTPRQKKHLGSHRRATKAAVTALGWHATEAATKALMAMFGGQKVFDFAKPMPLMRFFCDQLLRPGDLALDFFAGSGTTAHAVWEQNAEDGGGRRVILVQRPEPCAPGGTAALAGFGTVTEVLRARLALAAQALGGPRLTRLLLR